MFKKLFGHSTEPQALHTLTVKMAGQEIAMARFNGRRLEITPACKINGTLEFVTSDGQHFEHTFSETGWLHLCARVEENMAVLIDAVVDSQESTLTAVQKFSSGEARGIRFQPFCFKASKIDTSTFAGQGLFARGLHFSGNVTPGTVSLSCICDECKKSFRLQSHHCGFGSCNYFYSDSGLHTLFVSEYEEGCPPLMTKIPDSEIEAFEAKLPASPDGGKFRYLNPLRCPHCSAPYIDFKRFPDLRQVEYYGNFLFGTEPESWTQPALSETRLSEPASMPE